MTDTSSHLYESLAARMAEAIHAGALKTGDRLPSVRRLSTQHRVSIATAVQAYRHLENQRLIEARPKSGYFVLGKRAALAEPADVDATRGRALRRRQSTGHGSPGVGAQR